MIATIVLMMLLGWLVCTFVMAMTVGQLRRHALASEPAARITGAPAPAPVE